MNRPGKYDDKINVLIYNVNLPTSKRISIYKQQYLKKIIKQLELKAKI